MRIGVDYYPEHWEETRWPVDAKLMREAGITIVRLAEFAWCKMEPVEGHFDFSWLDRAITTLHKEGVQVILGTPTATPPAWLHEKYPDIYPADARKYRLGFGTRLQRCMNHPDMRRYSRQITQAMASHYTKNPAVVGWQIDNEFEGNLCYCDICAEKFRDWLKGKYGTLENLNKTWGTIFWSQEYSKWSQIPLPWVVRCGQSHNPSLWLDYRRFASETTISFQHEQVEIIRRLAPHHFITHNFMGLSDSVDYFELAKDLDFVAWDNYPGGGWQSASSQNMPHDIMRGIKQKNYWMMEQQSNIPGWEKMARRPYMGRIRAWAWQAVAHGADTVIFFRWRSCLYGTEQYWHGILNHDGKPRRRYKEIARFGKELKDSTTFLDNTIVQNEIAILNSYEQNWSLQIQPQVDGLSWWNQMRHFYNSLTRLGLNCDIVPITVDLTQYKLVILPSWYVLTEVDAKRLSDYVKKGGTLILNPRTGVKTQFNTCHSMPLPSLVSELAGLEIDDYDPLGNATAKIQMNKGKKFTVTVWADALLLHQAQPIATYLDENFAGEPAIALNQYGKGKVYTFGTYGEPNFYDYLLDEIISKTGITWLGEVPKRRHEMSHVEISWRVKENLRFLFLINLSNKTETIKLSGNPKTILGQPVKNKAVKLPPFEVGIYQFISK